MNNKAIALSREFNREKDLLLPLFLITIFILIDIGNDFSITHIKLSTLVFDIIIELLILSSTIWLGFSLARYYTFEKRSSDKKSEHIKILNGDLKKWQKNSEALTSSYQKKLYHYLKDEWELSKAEVDVTKMVLQGLSYKEIAHQRNLSEKTIRNQAQSIYEKSQLSGRKELSAFFLNDLLG